MPEMGVDRERRISVLHSACIRERGDAAQQAVAHEKGEKHKADLLAAQPRVSKQDIHGDAAQLERKIPEVVMSAGG